MESTSTEKTRWMRGASTPLRGALLGLLLERPGHGGDLANRLAARLGESWRVDTNDVYRLLEQLERMGLAASRDEPKRSNIRRTHLVYHPTEETAAALSTWMETLTPREPVRLGLQAKLSVARPEDAPLLIGALRAYEHECQVLAHAICPREIQAQSWQALRIECTRDAAYVQLNTEIEWAARTRVRINQFLGTSF
jgi:DNA-binding PadR family transcriptional regulator